MEKGTAGMSIPELIRCEDLDKSEVADRIDQLIGRLKDGGLSVPKVRERNAVFQDGRWVMPRKTSRWKTSQDCGRRLLGMLEALKMYVERDEMKSLRDLWYTCWSHFDCFRPDGELEHPRREVNRYFQYVEGLLGAERETLGIIGEGKGYLWAPKAGWIRRTVEVRSS